MNDPNSTEDDYDGLQEDLEAEFMEMARKGDYDAVTFAILESDTFLSTLKGITIAILKHKMTGHKTLLESISNVVAPAWAAQELPKRISAMKEMRESWHEAEKPEAA